jgi:hypothetical protein
MWTCGRWLRGGWLQGGCSAGACAHGVLTAANLVQDTLLRARQELLDKLHEVHEERTKLNQVAMAIMLPRCSLADFHTKGGPTAEKLRRFSSYGAGSMLSQTAELVTAMNKLKANILFERRSLVQLHTCLLRQVCTAAHCGPR